MKKILSILLLPVFILSTSLYSNSSYDLIRLAENYNIAGVQQAIQNGANPNQTDLQGFTALHVAAWNGYTEIVEILLNSGANPNILTKSGSSPLRFANAEVSNMLISYGAYQKPDIPPSPEFVNSTNVYIQYLLPTQQTTKTVAIPARRAVTKVISNFITNSFYYSNTVDIYPKKSYRILADISPLEASLLYDWDDKGNNALHRAAGSGNIDIVLKLIEQGINPFSKNNNGDNALRFAVQEKNFEIVQYLLEEIGLDVNSENNQGTSSIIFAALNNDIEMIDYLVQMGANVNSPASAEVKKTVDGKSDIFVVSNWTPMMSAAQMGNNDAIQNLLDNNADLNMTDSDGWNAVHFAAQNQYLETVQLLIKAGIDYNIESKDKHTPLSLAIDNGDQPMIDFLTELGAAKSSVPQINLTENIEEIEVEVESYEYYEEEYADEYVDETVPE